MNHIGQHREKLYKSFSPLEKLFLKTCCYLPQKPRKGYGNQNPVSIDQKIESDTKHIKGIYDRSLFESEKPLKVLDFGCGAGIHATAIATLRPDYQVFGVDINLRYDAAKNYAADNAILNVSYIHGSTLDLAAESFDVILSHDSFEHFDDPLQILVEMHRLLKPNGKVYLKFGPLWKSPYGRHLGGMVRKDRPWVHLWISEKSLMKVYSYLADLENFLERYAQIPGGMNEMTVNKFKETVKRSPLTLERWIKMRALPYTDYLMNIKFTEEYFTGSISAVLLKQDISR